MADKIRYDLIILGAGPAGMTAGVYAARKQLTSLIISSNIGGQATWSSGIENYMGFSLISGVDLVAKFEEHLRKFKIDLKFGNVVGLRKEGGVFTVDTDSLGSFEATAVIIASGKSPRMLSVPGEREYTGKGVAYCATCDGPLFEGMDVAVVGGGNSGVDAALQLQKICPKVYMIEYANELRADEIVVKQLLDSSNVEVLKNTKVVEIHGDKMLTGMTVEDRTSKEAKHLEVQGVFVEVGLSPNTSFIGDLLPLNANGEIPVDCAGRTGIPGLYAAGDVTNVPEKQIIIAAGDGAKAALMAYSYILRLPSAADWGAK